MCENALGSNTSFILLCLHRLSLSVSLPHVSRWPQNEKESCFFPISYLNLVSYYRLNINRFQVNTNACRFPSLRQKKVPGTDVSHSRCEADEPLVWGLFSSGWMVGKRSLGFTMSFSALTTPCFSFCLSSFV